MGLFPTLRPPVTEVRAQYEAVHVNFSDRVYGGGWRMDVSITYDRRFPLPPEPSSSEVWQVGFIQNVLGVSGMFRYDSGRTVRISDRIHWLDAERPGSQAWVHRFALTPVQGQPASVRAWAPINYGAG